MSIDLKKRFDRIVEILIQLQSKRIVKAQDLADRFEVSLRTIYRDMKSLEQAGVPIIGEAGTGYSIMNGYNLPPVSFNKEEALSFVATEKLAEKFFDNSTSRHYGSAMMKIKAILKSHDQEMLEHMQGQIIMKKQDNPIFSNHAPQLLNATLTSIAQKRQLRILYQGIKDDQANDRTIEPLGVLHEIGYWYIIAYCLVRKDYRQFRSDRVMEVNLLESDFSKEHLSMEEYIALNPPTTYERSKVRIKVSKEMAPHVRWQRNHYGYISEEKKDDHFIMQFDCRDIEHEFPRWLLMFADHIEVLEPAILKTRMMEIIQDINLKFR
ncbi:helix-turn-helix transcriptional regulator [Sphingobacterium sp. 1.A.4]|uniref:helix-turn-helix transcriptional regulator n=1 Tax=Sphingobacterium sp. 1.A.4 TaxID=2044603 RepID=UPI000C0BEB37|nr:YafY family protein [Sphingobacterium sp. 1.A.4]